MKRGKKLLVLCIVCAALLAAAILLPKLPTDSKVSAAETEPTAVPAVLTADGDAVRAMSWSSGEVTLSFDRENGWQYPAEPDFPVDAEKLDALLSAVTAVAVSKTIPEPEELSAYGLAEPALTVVLTMEQGSYTLCFGNASGTGEASYLSCGDGAVYLADPEVQELFTRDLIDYARWETLPELTEMNSLTVETRYGTLCLQRSGDVWQENGTVLDEERTESFLDTVQQLEWLGCVCWNADALDLQVYGLDEPDGTLTITGTDGTLMQLEFTEDGYARLSGSGMLYKLVSADCDTLLYTTAAELMPDEVLQTDWETVKSAVFTLDGETHTAVRLESAEDGRQNWNIAGLETDLAALRELLDGMNGSGYALGAQPQRSMQLRIELTADTGEMQMVEFYPYDSVSCLVQREGKSTVFITRSQMEELMSAIRILVD